MKQVRCISPHGGCHNGMYHDGRPVFPVWDGQAWALPDVPPQKLRLPANPGGYVDDGRIPGRHAAVGQVYEVGDDFIADGFHWEEADGGGATPVATPAGPPLASLTLAAPGAGHAPDFQAPQDNPPEEA